MSETQSNNKRIAKNAIALYIRMIVMMLIGLYTSRIILNALGVVDFGIYNVVGGFVSMFSLVSSSLQSSISRSLTFELGKGSKDILKQTFSTSFWVLIAFSLILVVIIEIAGVWYLENKMVIPVDRIDAAHWCFQFSVIAFVLGIINTPYSSCIIAHERMDIYAYFTLLDAAFKLLICFAVMHSPIDKLIMYAAFLFGIGIINQIIYVIFCVRKFEECHLQMTYNKNLFRSIFNFAGWNFIGCSAAILRTQGATLLLNVVGGPIVNAANGIANQLCNIANSFVSNFTQAFNPQITKQYAAGQYESLMKLLIYGSKYSYYMLFFLALPIMFNADFILKLWLGQVPEHTVAFARWIIIFLLAESVSRPIITAKNATGEIKNYQIVVGSILLLMLPLSYAGLKLGMPVEVVPFCNALTACMAIVARMYMLNGVFPTWSTRVFIRRVLLNVIGVSIAAGILPAISYNLINQGWTNFLVTSTLCVICCVLSMYYIGCSKSERDMLKNKANSTLSKLKSKISHDSDKR